MNDRLRWCGEVLLKLRMRRQNSAAREFMRAKRDVDAVANRIDELRRALTRQDDAARRAILSGEAEAELQMYRQCVREAGRLLADRAADLELARDQLEVRRGRLLDAVRQRRAAQALRNRLMQRDMMSRRAAETTEADDLHAMYQAGSSHRRTLL